MDSNLPESGQTLAKEVEEVATAVAAASPAQATENKNPFLSYTLWMSLATILIPQFPVAAEIVKANPSLVPAILGVVFAALRFKTKAPVGFVKK